MKNATCLFCMIGLGHEPAKVVLETGEFLCIENKYPSAPVHVLVIPKAHVSKKAWLEGKNIGVTGGDFWGKIMAVVFEAVVELGLDKTGYKLVLNGAGYNHFDHEHVHILGGTKSEPGGAT